MKGVKEKKFVYNLVFRDFTFKRGITSPNSVTIINTF